MKHTKKLFTSLLVVGILCTVVPAFADSHLYRDRSGVVIRGYDVVTYLADNRAVRGKSEFSHSYEGGVWYFENAENLVKFRESPGDYVPQYGGYCSYAMATKGKKVRTDQQQYLVRHNNKLHLFYARSGRDKFAKDPDALTERANKNWEKLGHAL